MSLAHHKRRVSFEEPFWVGLFERVVDGKLSVCKVTFGVEPKDYEVYDFIRENYYKLKFSPAVNVVLRKVANNPKRLQRSVKKQTQNIGIKTKSQQALQLQREEMKVECKKKSKQKKELDKKRKYELKQQKRKEKHRGR